MKLFDKGSYPFPLIPASCEKLKIITSTRWYEKLSAERCIRIPIYEVFWTVRSPGNNIWQLTLFFNEQFFVCKEITFYQLESRKIFSGWSTLPRKKDCLTIVKINGMLNGRKEGEWTLTIIGVWAPLLVGACRANLQGLFALFAKTMLFSR